MLYLKSSAATPGRDQLQNTKLVFVIALLLLMAASKPVSAQSYSREMETADKVSPFGQE